MDRSLRPISDAPDEGDASLRERVARATGLSWLAPAFTCDDCGEVCEPSVTYSYRLYEPVPSWECTNCGAAFHRDASESSLTFSIWRD